MSATLPIVTERLVLRMMRTPDAPVMAAYRDDPEIAKHQLWDLPFTLEKAQALLADQDDRDELVLGEWTTLAVELDGVVIGEVCTHIDPTGGVAEIGYSLAKAHHGKGYASEAASALVAALFDGIGVVRVFGELDPPNVASQRVLEAAGLVFESLSRKSFRWRGEWTDNMTYAVIREDYETWRSRPMGRPESVELVVMTPENAWDYYHLTTHRSQETFVANMPYSFSDALFPVDDDNNPSIAWMQGIVADGTPAGFLMTADVNEFQKDPYLWRLLIDRRFQRRGIGRMAMDLHLVQLRERGYRRLLTSWVEGPGSPKPFHESVGFVPTGRIVDGETEAAMPL